MKNVNTSTQTTQTARGMRGPLALRSLRILRDLCVKTLRAVGDALWLLWMLPGFVIAACAASAEEERDARLKAMDGGAL